MGFLIHTEEAPEYQVHFSMWEWGRVLDLILWSNDIIDLDELKDRLTASQLKESNAKAEQVGVNPAEFDLAEWQEKVKIEQKKTKKEKEIIVVHSAPDETGRNIFDAISQTVSKEPTKEEMEKMVRTGAISLSVFQDLEDKMFDNKDKLGHLYGIQGNEFDFSRKACWEVYSSFTCIMTGDECFITELMDAGVVKLKHQRAVKKKKSKQEDFLLEIVEEYLGLGTLAKMTRLTGILVNSIILDHKAIVR